MLKHVSVIPLYKKVHIKSLKIESKNKRGRKSQAKSAFTRDKTTSITLKKFYLDCFKLYMPQHQHQQQQLQQQLQHKRQK